jgi:hypothetical protein
LGQPELVELEEPH